MIRFGAGDVPLVAARERRTPHGHTNTGARPVRISKPLPVLGHEPIARVRPRGGAGIPAGSAGRRLARGGHRARSKRSRSSRSGATRRCLTGLSRDEHALRHGPTTGDRVRVGDTDLWLRIEEDLTEPGDQALWGYAKNWRSRMTQHDAATTASGARRGDRLGDRGRPPARRDEGRPRDQGRPDHGIGRAGNPDIADGVELVIGPDTCDPVPRVDRDAWDVDSHVHLLSPRLMPVALSAGVTTLISAGFEEPAERIRATYGAMEDLPVNIGLQPSPRPDVDAASRRSWPARSGSRSTRTWGPTRRSSTRPSVRRRADIAVCLHSDGLNEATEVGGTVEAIAGRTIHAYRVEGAGGGHTPDAMGMVATNVFGSSTTPTLPYGPARLPEQLAMKVMVHEGNPGLPEDVSRQGAPASGGDGRGGAAPRARRDPDRELRLAGYGPDPGDVPADAAASARDEGLAGARTLGAGTPRRPAAASGGARARRRARRQRPSAPLPGEVHDRAGDRPRDRPGGRHARARTDGQHRAVVVVPPRGEAADGAERRRDRMERDGRGQRKRARRRADAIRPRLGSPRRRVGSPIHHVRVAGGARRGLRGDHRTGGSSLSMGPGGSRATQLVANRATPAGMSISPVDGTVELDGRVLSVEPTPVVPLSRRYLLA